ncbi:hypothetical protein HCN44_003501 [Aphidius gifuensis]|uniref:Uncharacterized protein n=1 Tax=Aphidius gifuensis TaxID=684658 RepID=A0A834XK27_APHGI|nr:hypothetical protein HCN44_003501 [Aphidius gifuensis]
MDTKSVLMQTQKTGKFNEQYAQLVVNRVVETLIDKFEHKNWDEEHFEKIGKNLATICNAKDSVFWSFKKGKIRERFKNYTQKCLKIQGLVKQKSNKIDIDLNAVKLPEINDDSEVNKSIVWLKKNSEGELEDIINHWVKTEEYRKQWMDLNKTKTVELLHQDWPILMNPKYGPDLVSHDFDNMKVNGNIDSNWDSFFEYVHENFKCKSHSKECKKILEWTEVCISTSGGKMMCQLIHLAYLFPLRGNGKLQSDSKGKGISIVNSTNLSCKGMQSKHIIKKKLF